MEDRALIRGASRAALLVIPALALTLRNALAPIDRVLGRVPDDALFYLVFARNLTAGRGVTFDGIDATSGFHPLWLAIVACLPLGDGPATGVRALIAAHGLAVACAVLALDGVLRRAGVSERVRGVGAAAAGVWGATAYGIGMETTLVAAVALGLVGVGQEEAGERKGIPRGTAVILGFLLGVGRMDMVPLVVGAGRRTGAALLGALGGVATTFALNVALSGEAISTSARMKGLGSVGARLARLDLEAVWRHFPGPLLVAIGVVAIGVLAIGGRVRLAPSACPAVLAAVAATAQIVASYLCNNLVGPWYFVPATWLFVALAFTRMVSPDIRALPMIGTTLLVASLLRGAGLPAPGLHTTVRGFAVEMGGLTAQGDRLIAEDFPGILAWFSGRDVLPADGLAAGPGYRAALEERRAMAWWEARGATHYIVTRRRLGWLEGVDSSGGVFRDHIAPPFLPVPPSIVTLEAARIRARAVDAGSGRVFVLVGLVGGG